MSTTKKQTKSSSRKLQYDALTKEAIERDNELCTAANPPAPPPPPPLTPADHEAHARNIKELGSASAMYMAMSGMYGSRIDLQSYKILIDDFMRDIGNPKDPVLRMMAEQMFLTHHVSSRLQARAAMMEGSENLSVFLSGAAKMMSEFRKHTALFSELRARNPEQKEANTSTSPAASAQLVDTGKNISEGKVGSKQVAGVKTHAA